MQYHDHLVKNRVLCPIPNKAFNGLTERKNMKNHTVYHEAKYKWPDDLDLLYEKETILTWGSFVSL